MPKRSFFWLELPFKLAFFWLFLGLCLTQEMRPRFCSGFCNSKKRLFVVKIAFQSDLSRPFLGTLCEKKDYFCHKSALNLPCFVLFLTSVKKLTDLSLKLPFKLPFFVFFSIAREIEFVRFASDA